MDAFRVMRAFQPGSFRRRPTWLGLSRGSRGRLSLSSIPQASKVLYLWRSEGGRCPGDSRDFSCCEEGEVWEVLFDGGEVACFGSGIEGSEESVDFELHEVGSFSGELVADFDEGFDLFGVGHARNMSALPTNGKDYFRHCRFIFSVYGLPMSFAESLTDYTAAQIVSATGCSRGTAYDWKDGRREPPAWQQHHWLAIIARGTRKRHNKDLHATPRKRAGKAER